MVHATAMAVAVPLGQPGPWDVLHQGRPRTVTCTSFLPTGGGCLLATPGIVSALCLCYWLHQRGTNPVGHPTVAAGLHSRPAAPSCSVVTLQLLLEKHS